jgi:serine protease Do
MTESRVMATCSQCLWMSVLLFLVAGHGYAQRSAENQISSPLEQINSSLHRMLMNVLPSVVQVEVFGYSRPDDDQTDDGEKPEAQVLTKTTVIGSGVILGADGYIITNAHVIEGASRVRVNVDDEASTPVIQGRRPHAMFEARVIGKFEEADLALLKINANGLPIIPLADSDSIHQGELVFSVGNPEGLRNSVAMGIVSAIARSRDGDRPVPYIQTDAPVNAGNSGGALVDVNGRLVGIPSFILSESGGSEGLGFALPSNLVQLIYQELRTRGHVRVGEIGVRVQSITPILAGALGLSQDWGIIISDVEPNSPADTAGLHVQDLLVALDGNPVRNLPQFSASFYLKRGGDRVTVEVLRGSRRLRFDIPVVEKNEQPEDPLDLISKQSSPIAELGILCASVNQRPLSETSGMRSKDGIMVLANLSRTHSKGGLSPGDLIRSVNGARVSTVEVLQSTMRRLKTGDPVALQIERKHHFMYVFFGMD